MLLITGVRASDHHTAAVNLWQLCTRYLNEVNPLIAENIIRVKLKTQKYFQFGKMLYKEH